MNLLLRQQPVAGDLRSISSALRMISDMERIGDQASDIAELADYIGPAGDGHMTAASSGSGTATQICG